MMRSMKRITVHFSGHVQGVGFRYTAKRVAASFTLAGYVMNLDDGRVLLEIEGDEAELDRYIAALHERMSDHIHEKQIVLNPACGQFGPPQIGGLSIRH